MKSNYLPIAFKLAGHYEIVEVLGEDDFEILYLVKDLHMGEKKLVLKELFLPSYSSRNDDNTLNIMAKSKQIFEQTKKDVIAEIEVLKSTQQIKTPQLYGYFEENNTLYTIMEFINDRNITSYLEFNAKQDIEEQQLIDEEKIEPIVEEASIVEEKKPKSTLFLKILIVCVVLFLGLAFYGYQILEEDKQRIKEKSERNSVTLIKKSTIPHPALESREEKKEESLPQTSIKEINRSSYGAEYIEPSEIEDEISSEALVDVPKEEIYQSEDELEELAYTEGEPAVFEEEVVFEEKALYSPEVVSPPASNESTSSSMLGTRIN